jgi:hypothetical protein
MIRCIRTEFMYLKAAVPDRWLDGVSPGVSVAFMRGPFTGGVTDIPGVKVWRVLSEPEVAFTARQFIGLSLLGVYEDKEFERRWSGGGRTFIAFGHGDLAEEIWRGDVVYEQSPPKTAKLSALIKGSSAAAIGAFIGAEVAGPDYPLLFATVPAGIIIVGSAFGISRGLETGLAEAVSRLFDPSKRSQPLKPKRKKKK